MTRVEFIEDVLTMDELYSAYADSSFLDEFLERVIPGTDMEDRIKDDLTYAINTYNWWEVRDMLYDISLSEERFYVYNGVLDYDLVEDGGDMFEYLKDRFIEMADDSDEWEGETDEVDDENHKDTVTFQGGVDLSELLTPVEYSCSQKIETDTSVIRVFEDEAVVVRIDDVESLLF